MNLTQEEIEKLKKAAIKTDNEWNEVVDKILLIRNGQYPPDWYQVVIAGGIKKVVFKITFLS